MAIGRRIGLAALAAIVVAGVAAGVALALTGGSSGAGGATSSNAAFAARRANALIGALRIPGSRPAPTSSSAAGATTSGRALVDAGAPAAGDAVVRSRTVTVARDPATVRRELLADPPTGMRALRTHGSTLRFVAVAPPRRIVSERLSVALVAAGPHATAAIAQARVAWIRARPATERVPSGARLVEITRARRERTPGLSLRVTQPARVAALARMLDGLAPVQPGNYLCAAQLFRSVRVRIVFRARAGGPVLAEASLPADEAATRHASSSPCAPTRFSVHGRAMPSLLGGTLLRRAGHLLGVRLWLAPYAA